MGNQDIADIQNGRKLADLELRQSLNRSTLPELSPAFAIGNDEPLLGALFAVDTLAHPRGASGSYRQWLERQPERTVTN